MNFPGEIWPVNPGRESVCGVPCFGKISDLPGAPDAAFSGVNRKASVRVARELAEAGCGGAVFFAAGFAEARDDGLQRELAEAAGAMPFLGPNCYGLVNYLDGAPLWPDQHGGRKVERGVAVVSQSSNIANNITMGRRGLPLAYVVCAGNQARVGVSQIGAALLEDPRVTALGFYLEGVDHPEAFAALSKLARERGSRLRFCAREDGGVAGGGAFAYGVACGRGRAGAGVLSAGWGSDGGYGSGTFGGA